ncbi:MAG: hypothetical protein JSU70_10845 [Phycisphaerales bacterium]|nr:MAG: hypothetical protein JSU70_10845 [Phycisphaerales bacterium]
MRRRNTDILLTLIVATLCVAPPATAGVIYVDDDATGANDGSSWGDAYNHLQDALAHANSLAKPVEVRVAQGIYRPDRGAGNTLGDREAAFQLISGVVLKGGFAGIGELSPNVRDVEVYRTILSGDLNGDDVDVNDAADFPDEPARADNSYHVVTGSNTDATAVLDGFAITAGHAISDPTHKDGAGLFNETGSPTIANCRFYRNAASDGGGIFNHMSNPALTNCSFENNYGGSWGGGMLNVGSSSNLVNCTFCGNVAYSGGAISNMQSSLTLSYCAFESNHASEGGAIQNGAGSTAELVNSSFTDNHATSGGGGALRSDFSSRLTLSGCSITANSAHSAGGAVYSGMGASATLTDCTVSENSAGERGGAIHNDGTLTVTDCAFVRNSHTPWRDPSRGHGGGAVYNNHSAKVTLARCVFESNTAPTGGAVFNWWGSAGMFTDCHFNHNTAIWAAEDFDRCSGGAIWNESSYFSLLNCSFTANTATGDGGGMCNDAHDLKLTNCLFSGNAAPEGGAIRDYSNTARLTNCTFVQNWAVRGNALAGDPWAGTNTLVEVANSVLWDRPDQISIGENATVAITYSNVKGGYPGQGNIDADPRFTALGYWAGADDPNVGVEPTDPNAVWVDGDYHLMSQAGRWEPATQAWVRDDVTSPCIDAGNALSPIGYEPFPNGGRLNMGAYGGTTQASKSYFGEPIYETIVAGDVNGDCKVDYADFAAMAGNWLKDSPPAPGTPPTVTITEPADGAVIGIYDSNTPITIRADASDRDGVVAKVEFTITYSTANRFRRRSSTDGNGSDGWQFEWFWWDLESPFPEGEYTIVACAIDDDGAFTASPSIGITVHGPK